MLLFIACEVLYFNILYLFKAEGSWGRGTLQQPPQSGSAGGQPQNAGSGVNGPQTSSDTQPLPSQHMRDQRPYSSSRSSSGPSNMGVSAPQGPPIGSVPPMTHGPGMGSQMGPGSSMHPPPQYRQGMMPPFVSISLFQKIKLWMVFG